jgi:hypothetical protein
LLRDGTRAEGVVLEREGANLTQHGFSAFKLVLEVRFPDGSRSELREKLDVEDIGLLHGRVGDVLPVRYDPDDHSALAIDVPALRAELESARRRRDEEAVARGRRRLDCAVDPPTAAQGVGAQLAELTQLRRALDAGQIDPGEYQRLRRQIVSGDRPG